MHEPALFSHLTPCAVNCSEVKNIRKWSGRSSHSDSNMFKMDLMTKTKQFIAANASFRQVRNVNKPWIHCNIVDTGKRRIFLSYIVVLCRLSRCSTQDCLFDTIQKLRSFVAFNMKYFIWKIHPLNSVCHSDFRCKESWTNNIWISIDSCAFQVIKVTRLSNAWTKSN